MPGLFFCFLAREIFRAVRTKTFSTRVRAQFAPRVRKTGLSTHARSTIPDMGPRSWGALLLVDVYPVEGLEPGEPASPYTWGVALIERNTFIFKMSGPVFILGGSH